MIVKSSDPLPQGDLTQIPWTFHQRGEERVAFKWNVERQILTRSDGSGSDSWTIYTPAHMHSRSWEMRCLDNLDPYYIDQGF